MSDVMLGHIIKSPSYVYVYVVFARAIFISEIGYNHAVLPTVINKFWRVFT